MHAFFQMDCYEQNVAKQIIFVISSHDPRNGLTVFPTFLGIYKFFDLRLLRQFDNPSSAREKILDTISNGCRFIVAKTIAMTY